MTVTLDPAAGDPHQIIADLKRELVQRTTERNAFQSEFADAVDQQTATADLPRPLVKR